MLRLHISNNNLKFQIWIKNETGQRKDKSIQPKVPE